MLPLSPGWDNPQRNFEVWWGLPSGKDQLVGVVEARQVGGRCFESVLPSCRPCFEVEGLTSASTRREAGISQSRVVGGHERQAEDMGPGVRV